MLKPKNEIKVNSLILKMKLIRYIVHFTNLLQVEGEQHFVKFIQKIDEDFIEVEKEDKTLIKINKNVIISVVQIEKNGRLTYIKYRD